VKRLSLLRHAKSSWKDASLPDFERPLNKRGRRDAPRMGARLAAAGFRPDGLLSSPAERARATALSIAAEIGYPEREIVFEPALYPGEPDALLARIRALPDAVAHAALVAHNPGLTELSNRLADRRIDNIPTAGVVQLELAVDTWGQVADGCGRLLDFAYPKQRAGGD
jgi:phosphohistidine phosphatase